MIFLISLALAALFIWGCAKPLKKHPTVFYIAAAVIALAVIGCTWGRVSFPAWFQNWVWPLASRGAFATALFAAVMWTGALPNGSKAVRLLMPIRGELSILACILTLAHNISYGRTYFRFLFAQPGRLPVNQLAAAVCSLVLMVIMLPLFVTSFPAVRKKMNARSWKRLQRLAYGFYALLCVHIMLLSIPSALDGRGGYALNVLVYSVVFLGYAVCRVMKAQALKTRKPDKLFRRQAVSLVCVLAVSLCLSGAVSVCAAREENALSQTPLRPESLEPEENPEPETLALPEAPEDAQDAEAESPDPVPSADEQTEEPQPAAETPEQAGAAEEPSQSEAPQESQTQAPAPEPTPTPAPTPTPTPTPAPERTYQNGTFSGSGEGYWSTITVSVTIQDDVITAITVTSADEDEPYYSNALSVINRILTLQSTDVDTVSGATYSSGGIIDAVAAALASAKN
ncbi:MAG: FMN-binding protein [Oscillospiraceae bacterium]